ncbi:MAG TPA: tetratricopeptide repeat protein [Polyangiaceae bacterium]|nr:tetratricopeptide repeat protein [Polyangiaceae bacterium]
MSRLTKHIAWLAIGVASQFQCLSEALAQDSSETNSSEDNPAALEVTRLNEEGMGLYKLRDYRRAVEKFIQAYAIDHDPNLLFNIARCYEQLGDVEAAIEKYEEFVKMPGADTQGRQRAYDSLNQLHQLANTPKVELEPTREEQHTEQAPPKPEPAPPVARESGPGLLPWVLLGAGVLTSAAGATVYYLGQSDHQDVENQPNFGEPGRVVGMTRTEAKALVDSGDQKKLMGLAGLGVGGALLITSAVLFIWSGDTSNEESATPQAALVPLREGAGLWITGRF